jgi:hypothetical protein
MRLRHACTVNARATRVAVRSLVAATVACALAGLIAARVVLSHRSGTYIALAVFLPLLVAPGAFLWRSPRPRYLLLWSIGGWIVSLAWVIGGTQYAHGIDNGSAHELAAHGWAYVSTPMWIAIGLVLFAAPTLALFSIPIRRPPPELALLATRLRRVVMLVSTIALGLVVLCLVRFEGLVFAFYALLLIAPGLFIYRNPNPIAAWLWTVVCAPCAAIGITLWWSFGNDRSLIVRIFEAGLGTISVLVLLGVPLILMATPRFPITDSSARATYRFRRR